MRGRYRAALIGAGRYAGLMEDELPAGYAWKPYSHLPALLATPEVTVVAAASDNAADLARFATRFGLTQVYADYREMVTRERPDLVAISTPSSARAAQLIFCAEQGVRGIFSEKGLCGSLAELDAIDAAFTKHGVAFNWGALRRYHPGYQQLAAAVAAGAIGEPRQAVFSYRSDLIAHQSHALDLVAMLLGDPTPVWVAGSLQLADAASAPDRPQPTYDPATHRFVPPPGQATGDPVAGVYRVGYATGAEATLLPVPGQFALDLLGTAGRALAWDNGATLAVHQAAGAGTRRLAWPATRESPTQRGMRDLIQALETGQPSAGNWARTKPTVEVQFALARSHLEGGARVTLPSADRTLVIAAN